MLRHVGNMLRNALLFVGSRNTDFAAAVAASGVYQSPAFQKHRSRPAWRRLLLDRHRPPRALEHAFATAAKNSFIVNTECRHRLYCLCFKRPVMDTSRKTAQRRAIVSTGPNGEAGASEALRAGCRQLVLSFRSPAIPQRFGSGVLANSKATVPLNALFSNWPCRR